MRHYHLKRKEKGNINQIQTTGTTTHNEQIQQQINTNIGNNKQKINNNNNIDIRKANSTNKRENNNYINKNKKEGNNNQQIQTKDIKDKQNNDDIQTFNNMNQREENDNNNINKQQGENKEGGNNSNESSDEETNTREGLTTRTEIHVEDFYGDEIDICGEETLRLVGININNIPESSVSAKNQQIFQAINESGAGIVGITEVGRCWHLIPEKDRWTERVKGWWENSKSTIAYNAKDVAPSKYQPGGSILCSIGKPCHRIVDSGVDKSGLGRWSWQRFRGKHNVSLRVISAYRPCRSPGANTVYSQHSRFFDATSDTPIQPRKQFFEDLSKEILNWKNEEHDQIVLMMDANTNTSITTDRELQEFLRTTNLMDAVTCRHQEKHGLQPTHHNGQHPIDGIFVSNTLHPIRCGYLPFGDFPSDHRAIWIDLTFDNCFGYKMPKATRPSARRLKSSDPKIRNRWNQLYADFIKQHKIHQRIFKLETMIAKGGTMLEKDINEYGKIMKIRNQGIKYADKNCRKLTMGNVPFSPTIIATCEILQLWKGIKTRKSGRKFSLKKIKRLEKKHKINDAMGYSEKEVEAKIRDTMKKYKKQKKDAQRLRTTFLQGKATAMAEENNTEVEKILKQLLDHELQRTAARRIKATLGKLTNGSVTKVDVEQDDGRVIEETTKEGIERACMEENEKKYRQTQATPCMQEPLLSELGYLGITASCDQILEGTYQPPPGINQYTRELLQHMQRLPIQYPSKKATITTPMFKEGWKKIKENTSAASISGVTFGHMKACAQDDFLAEFEAAMANLPYATGFSPEQWQKGITLMIRKKANVDLVTKLRTIVLTEADFNYCNKVLGKMTLEHAERNKLLPKEQYGSRKGHNSIDHAVHKRLVYDIMRQSRRAGALCSNDAKSCFDRVVHSIAMLAYRRLGIAVPPVKCMLETIQNMKHHIRTNYGDSVFTMTSSGTLIPYQGILQGNGASPATWVIISAPLLDMLRTAGNGGHFVSPISKEKSHTVGFAFVDDTDLLHLDMRKNETEAEAMNNMQQAINRWEGGLKTTGGTIVNSKSWVYPISFEFDEQGKWKYKKVADIQHDFTVRDDQEIRQVLISLEHNEGKETLGVYLAPDGNNSKMVEVLKTKAEEWRDHINSGHLNKADAWQALETTIMKSLQYPMKALTLTKEECKNIMKPILQAGLQKSSLCLQYPRDVVFGSQDEAGIGIDDLYIHQGSERICFISEHLQEDTLSGELLRTSIELGKVELGIGRNIFQLDYKRYQSLMTHCWIKDVWKFCQEQDILIEDKVTDNSQLQRQGDVFLMEEIAHSDKFSALQLEKINRCRIHLQATTLADITNGYGTRLTTSARQCKYDTTRTSQYDFPVQPRPGMTSIRLWKRALKQCFPLLYNTSLTPQLHCWTVPVGKDQQWFYIPDSQRLFQKINNHRYRIWKRSSRAGNIGKYPQFEPFTNTMTIPNNSVRSTVEKIGNRKVRLTGWYMEDKQVQIDMRKQTICNNFLDDIDCINRHNLEKIGQSIEEGSLKIVSDGSYLESYKVGTAAWILETPEGISTSGRMIIPGHKQSQGSYRSELGGIYGSLAHVDLICKHLQIDNGKITLGCDGLGAVKIIEREFEVTKCNMGQFDVIRSINRLRKKTTIRSSLRHVKGHQDDNINYYQLDRWAQINVLVDTMAKQKLSETIEDNTYQQHRTNHFPLDLCSISFCSENKMPRDLIQSNLTKAIKTAAGRKRVRRHWRKKGKFNNNNEHNIDWTIVHRSHLALDKNKKKWLSKWMTGFCGVGKMMKIYGLQQHTKCPKCQQPNETTTHVMQCQSYGTHCLWSKLMRSFATWIEKNKGPETLAQAIIDNLTAWRQQSPFPPLPDDRNIRAAVLEQDDIGWRSFLDGFISTKWKIVIERHFQTTGSQKSAELWTSKMVRQIWDMQWQLWMNRNDTLYGEGNTIHLEEINAINEELTKQWMQGLADLPRTRYQHLFQGEFRLLYQKDHNQKRQWLTSVWLAREQHSDTPGTRNKIADNFFQRWMQRINPPSEDPTQENLRTTEPPTATLPYEDSPGVDPPSAYRINRNGTIVHASEDLTQESTHTTEPPTATLPCGEPPELDPPPPEPPPD